MLAGIKQFFEKNLGTNENKLATSHELAIACLLAEVIFADNNVAEAEWRIFLVRLSDMFNLSEQALTELADTAKAQVKQANDLYQFTHVVKEMPHQQRINLLEGLWQLAYADGEIDPHEDHIIRRICELIGLSHSDFIKAKLKYSEQH